ncbi:MAG: hypothetical protein Q7U88_14715 [Desulfocapsaceae bacterium]|nr:hypothetical protein [Desulfocapsaceae bacterium]
MNEVLVGGPIDALSSDALYSHSSSLRVSLYKKMERCYNGSNLNYSRASDTNVHPMDATTTHRKRRYRHRRQGQRTHTSRAALSTLVVMEIR